MDAGYSIHPFIDVQKACSQHEYCESQGLDSLIASTEDIAARHGHIGIFNQINVCLILARFGEP
jgi:hypothetical protein